MKQLKKAVALVLAMVMVLAMGSLTAFAQTSGTASKGTGTITVKNASKGDTYKLFKLFDATLTNVPATGEADGVAYTGTIPEELKDVFEKDAAGNIQLKEAYKGDDKKAKVTKKVQEWAATLTENDSHFVAKAVSDGSKLVFLGIPYGYYAVTSSLGAVISVDSNNPNVEIIDKNSTVPSVEKTVDGKDYSVGDTVTYTAIFDAPNYLPSKTDGGDPEQVISYKIKDTLPNFLSNVAITSIEIGKFDSDTKEAVGALQGTITDITAFDSNKTIEIEWATLNTNTDANTGNEYTSKYTSNTQIKVVYTATLTAYAQLVADNTNTVSLFPQVDRGAGKVPYQETDEWHDSAEVTTYGAALQKKDEDGNNLSGAEFQIAGLVVTGTDGLYTVVSYDPAGTTEGTIMKTDSNGLLRIGGLKSGLSLTVTETKAPDGYNKLENPFTLTTTKLDTTTTSTSGSVTRYYDEDGNLVDKEEDSTTSEMTIEYTSIENIPTDSINTVVNNKGPELPSTGGTGTTIFYILGSILVIGAGILLITKRRMRAGNN